MNELPGSNQLSSMATDTDALVSRAPLGGVANGLGGYDGFGGIGEGTDTSPAPGFSPLMLSRAKWLMLGVFVVAAAATIPCVWAFVNPIYVGTAIIRVRPVVQKIVYRNEENARLPSYRSFLNTQVSIIKDTAVLQRVLDRADVQRTSWYAPQAGGAPPSVSRKLEQLRLEVYAQPRRDTELIDVAMSGLVASDVKVIANAVVDEYLRFTGEMADAAGVRRLDTLRRTKSVVRDEIDGLQRTRFDLSNQLGTAEPEQLRVQLTIQKSTLENELQSLDREHAVVLFEIDRLGEETAAREEDGSGVEHDATLRVMYANDREWRRHNIAFEEARHQLELARQQLGESHPRIHQLASTMKYSRQLLSEREAQLDVTGAALTPATMNPGESPLRNLATLERVARRQVKQLDLLRQEIDKQMERIRSAGDIAARINRYDEDIRQKREEYETLRTRLTVLEMEAKAPGRIALQSYAIEPSSPERDRRMLMTAMCFGGAFALALGVGYLRVTLDSRIRGVGDVQQAVRAPFLGQIPPLPKTQHVLEGCSHALIECVRIVRTSLLERLSRGERKVLLITSSSSQTGKTSLAVLLGHSFASLGRRVLLVEADLRRPSLGGRLGLQSRVGLANLLTGKASDSEVILPSGVRGLDVILAGEGANDDHAELLADRVFGVCLERWKESYDLILLDSPPVLPVADARILAGQADGTVMVLRASHTRRAEVIQAYADVGAAGGTLLGTILVGVQNGGDYGYGYGYRSEAGENRHRSAARALNAESMVSSPS